MKFIYLLFFSIALSACGEKHTQQDLVIENRHFFSFYDATCEYWLENQYPCTEDSCLSCAAVEIVGIDTSISNQYQIFAWSWDEHLIVKGGKTYSGNKQLLITKFTIDPTTRANKILNTYIPNPDLPLEKQLIENGFPESLIDKYFIQQPESTERVRIQALAEKANDKFQLFLDKAYTPDTTVVTDSTAISTDSIQ